MICIIIILFIIILLLYYYIHKKNNQNICRSLEKYTTTRAPDVEFPFRNIKDDKYKNLNIIAITAPFRTNEHKNLFYKYKSDGFPILGVCSYQAFPSPINNPHEDPYFAKHNDDYVNQVIGWCHCYRPENKMLQLIKHTPHKLISESDFLNLDNMTYDPSIPKVYDFIYVCLQDNDMCTDGWQSFIRQWNLAKKCFGTLCDHKLKGLIIGRDKCKMDFVHNCNIEIEAVPFQPYHEFHKYIQKSRMLFVPNISDASPRVITEAMVYNVPVLVNTKIIGGWKYIQKNTGEFFDGSPEHFYTQFMKMRTKKYSPRNFILKNNNKVKKQFTTFLKQIYPSLLDCKYCRFAI